MCVYRFFTTAELDLRSGDHDTGSRGGIRIDNHGKDTKYVDASFLSVVEAAWQLHSRFLEQARFPSGMYLACFRSALDCFRYYVISHFNEN